MSLQTCYAQLGGNYEEVLGRLRNERIIRKFVVKFLSDGSYDLLCRSLEENNMEEAFRAAHTLKGVCQNLGFTQLYLSSSQLTEALRGGGSPQTQELVRQVREDYQKTAAAIRLMQEQDGEI